MKNCPETCFNIRKLEFFGQGKCWPPTFRTPPLHFPVRHLHVGQSAKPARSHAAQHHKTVSCTLCQHLHGAVENDLQGHPVQQRQDISKSTWIFTNTLEILDDECCSTDVYRASPSCQGLSAVSSCFASISYH